jgi:hypothetical protein
MTTQMSDFRRLTGILLRFPIVLFLFLLWVIYVWWWIAAFGLSTAVVLLILQPLLYPFLYGIEWVLLAFTNSGNPVLPNYFKNYPDGYVTWCKECFKLGFPTLRRWLVQGWASP